MAKMRSFLGFFASLLILFFTANVFAIGYVCETQVYTSCNRGYYLHNGVCEECPWDTDGSNKQCFCAGGTTAPQCGYCVKLNFDDNGGTGGLAGTGAEVYVKSNAAEGATFFGDTNCSSPLVEDPNIKDDKSPDFATKLLTLPSKKVDGADAPFTGYYASNVTGATQYINAKGMWTGQTLGNVSTKNVVAQYDVNSVKCEEGTYLPANSSTCQTCKAGYYCPGDTFTLGSSSDQGITQCPNTSTSHTSISTYVAATGSSAGASKVAQCIAYGLVFTNINNGSGTRTCYYTSGSGSTATYSTDCHNASYTGCNAGYYWNNNSKCTQCTIGYYCPGFSGVSDLTNDMGRNNCADLYSGSFEGTISSNAGSASENDCFYSPVKGEVVDSTGYVETCSPGNYANFTNNVYYGEDTECISCPAGYTDNPSGGLNAQSQCQAKCTAGTQVKTANAACSTPNNSGYTAGWYTTGTHYVNYGLTSGTNVKSCDAGYSTPNTTTKTDHDNANDCQAQCIEINLSVNAGGITNAGSYTSSVYKKVGNTTMYSDSECTNVLGEITPPSRTGSTFDGYWLDDGTTKCISNYTWDNAQCNPTENPTTLYAHFKSDINKKDNCNEGYTLDAPSNTCLPDCITITLDNTTNGGTTANATVYKKVGSIQLYSNSSCTSTISAITKPTKTNARYSGHYNTSDISGGTQCITASGTWSSVCNPKSDYTVYARYTCDTGTTQAESIISGSCDGTCFPFILDDTTNGGSGGQGSVYKQYGSATLYKDAACTTTIDSVSTPSKDFATFIGYFLASSPTSNNTAGRCITPNGTWGGTSGCNNKKAQTTIYAHYTCILGEDKNISGACETCENGEYLNGTACSSCPEGFDNSDVGATSSSQCYKPCTRPTSCPDGSNDCTYDTSFKVYFGSGDSDTCPIETVECDAGYYQDGKVCSQCPEGFDNSDVGATSSSQCYKDCEESCQCPANSKTCTYKDSTLSGKQYNDGSNTCIISGSKECEIETLTCKANYYKDGYACSACTDLTATKDGRVYTNFWTMSIEGSEKPGDCYKTCFVSCEQQECPDHATCKHGKEYIYGGYFYDSTDCTLYTPDTSCSITVTCDQGYKLTDNNTCIPVVAPVTLYRNYDSDDSTIVDTVYQKYAAGWYSDSAATDGTQLASIPVPGARDGYTFIGYYDAQTDGELIISADGELPKNTQLSTEESVQLYAHWTKDDIKCQPGKYYDGTQHLPCPEGAYCSGDGFVPADTVGCKVSCPIDIRAIEISSDDGRNAIGTCTAKYTNHEVTGGRANQTCHWDGEAYATRCTIEITECNAGYYRIATDSPTCSVVDKGSYSPENDLKSYACADLKDVDDTRTLTTDGVGAGTDAKKCYAECPEQLLTDAKGNVSGKIVATKRFYDEKAALYPSCPTEPQCSVGYELVGTECKPVVLPIALDHNGGTSTVDTIYLKYNNGWYSAQTATDDQKIKSVPVPVNPSSAKSFSGYRMLSGDQLGTTIADASGKLYTTTNALTTTTTAGTAQAQYDDREQIFCDAGTYYPGTGGKENCQLCTVGNYCPGNTPGYKDSGEIAGLESCATLVPEYAENATSDAGADGHQKCYATNLPYDKSHTRGTQTCYYNGLGKYAADCDITVTECDAGYYLPTGKVLCDMVGQGYYSAANKIDRTPCPNLDDGLGVTTETETSAEVANCYIDGLWAEDHTQTHGGIRRRCYHEKKETNTDPTAYNYNCAVGTVVTCDGGYYKATPNDGVCTPVGSEYYSPAQSAFEDEPAQPFADKPGSSTQRFGCPENYTGEFGTAKRKSDNNGNVDYAKCEYDFECFDGFEGTVTVDDNKNVTPQCKLAGKCPENHYCPDQDTVIKCPCDGKSDPGTEKVEGCYIKYDPYENWLHGQGSATCTWNADNAATEACKATCSAQCKENYNKCNGDVDTCEAGYYYQAGSGTTSCVQITDECVYNPGNASTVTPCPDGCTASTDDRTSFKSCLKECPNIMVPHAIKVTTSPVRATSETEYAVCEYTIAECEEGYDPNNNDKTNPSCDAKVFAVTLDRNGGTGNIDNSISCTVDEGCTLPDASKLTRAGYNSVNTVPYVTGTWCTNADGTGTCYAGGTSVNNISPKGADITLYAAWTPKILTITLNDNGATKAGVPNTVYLKYSVGWYADSAAQTPLTALSAIPEKAGYEFGGYKFENTPVVSAQGTFWTSDEALKFTTEDESITAVWGAGKVNCEPGYYYQGTGTTCLPCNDDNYCPGGTFTTDSEKNGEFACPDNGKTAAGAQASSKTQCFKENLNTYEANHGSGTQSCFYKNTDEGYADKCFDKVITKCYAGYWLDSLANDGKTDPDCSEVGYGWYSAEGELTHTECPTGSNNYDPVTEPVRVTTDTKTSATVNACYRTKLSTYMASHGTGTQTCYYTDGDGNNAIYNTTCKDKEITLCYGGYWLDPTVNNGKTAPDCSEVGQGYYSPNTNTDRTECPIYCPNYLNDKECQAYAGNVRGTTNKTNAAEAESCFLADADFTADNGGGKRKCSYKDGRYNDGCEGAKVTWCTGGYYYDGKYVNSDGLPDCVKVGYGSWSPVNKSLDDPDSLKKQNCAPGETTDTDTSNSASACKPCSENSICPIPGECTGDGCKEQSCATATNGKYPYSSKGNTSINGCYRDCNENMAENALKMKGKDYYDSTASTCEISYCKTGYTLDTATKTCTSCPEGFICAQPCEGNNCNCDGFNCCVGEDCNEPKSCAVLGDGWWPYSDKGASKAADCYEKCETYELDGGTAEKVTDRSYYNKRCEYKCIDMNGNPGDIEGGKCITQSCKPSYEMINGDCMPCNREHALSYKANGNCIVDSCTAGWHPYAQSCEPDTMECSAPNALRAEMQWDYKKNSYSICLIKECENGFHISSNACVQDVQECTVEHGVGEKEWNHSTGTWGACKATSCDPGFTNDPYESNEPAKQCGNCRNKFGIKGDLAASSYSRGCTISACMYQGELYNLENNECNPICDVNGYEDETGTMKWNPSTKKCERKCKDGYISW